MARVKTQSASSTLFSATRTNSAVSSRREELFPQIQQKAYELYERRGCAPGNDLADWLEAERIILTAMRRR